MERIKNLNENEDQSLSKKEILKNEESKIKMQLQFIKKYMKWHFSINESNFHRNNIISEVNFVFKRVTLSPDCKKIARLHYDRTISVYNLEKDLVDPILQIKGKLIDENNIRFSYNSERIAFYDERLEEINVWDIASQEIKYVYKETPDVLAFSKVGEVIGIITDTDVIKFYSQESLLSETKEIKSSSILDFAYNSSNLVCIVSEHNFYLWDFYTREILCKYAGDPEAKITCCRFNFLDDKIVAGTINKQILIWKIEKTEQNKNKNQIVLNYDVKKKPLFKMNEHTSDVVSVMISQDDKYLISYEIMRVPIISIWEKKINSEGEFYIQIDNFKICSTISSEAFNDNKFLLVGYDKYLFEYHILDKSKNDNMESIFGKRNNPIAYSFGNELVAKSLNNNLVHIFKLVSDHKTHLLTSIPYKKLHLERIPIALAFSQDNYQLALSFKNTFRIYNLDNLEKPKFESIDGQDIHQIRYLSKKTLLTGNKEGILILWNLVGDNFIPSIFPKSHEALITLISVNEKEDTFASGDVKGKICLWDINSMKLLGYIEEKETSHLNVRFFKSEKDQKNCIVGNSKCNFFFWKTPKLSEKLDQFIVPMSSENIEYNDEKNNFSVVTAYDFDLSPDEKKIVITFLDGRIALWSLERNEMIRVFNFFNYQREKDRGGIEIKFKPLDSKIIIAKAKECIKEMNIEPEVVEFRNINSMKLVTNDGKLISLQEVKMNKISVYDSLTGQSCYKEDLKIADSQQEIQYCYLSIDHKLLFGHNSKCYFVWNLSNGKLVCGPNSYVNKKELYFAYDKNLGETALIADSTNGCIYSWKKGNNDPLNIKNKVLLKNDNIIKAIQTISNLDISFDDSKVLIEYDSQRILIIDRKTNKKQDNFNIVNESNLIYLSKFSAKKNDNIYFNNIYSVMIEKNQYKIVEWDGITGNKIQTVISNQQIVKIVIEPKFNNLLILSKNNYLELYSPENKTFIRLTEFEEGKLENFFLNQKNDLFLRFKYERTKNEIKETEEEKNMEIVQIYYNFYKNSRFFLGKKNKLECIFHNNQISLLDPSFANTRMFPFNYNILQIMAYDQHCRSLEEKIFEIFSEKKLTIPFELFFSKDLHGRNCFDIAFLSKDTKLFKDFLEYILKNYEMTTIPLKYRMSLNSKFFLRMFQMFENNLIIPKFLEFVFSAPMNFPPGYMHQKLTKPIIETLDEPSISIEQLNKLLKEKKNSIKDKVNELVLAKCFYSYEFLDYENEATKKIFKIVSNFDPSNPIFGNHAIVNILEYKWNSYARNAYFKETFYFFIFLSLYVLNVDYFFVSRIQLAGQNSENMNAFIICSIISDFIICTIILRFVYQEIKQLYNLGLKDYFSSFWNYNDICYISFSLISTILDFLCCVDLFSYTSLLKCFQSLAIFFAFFRILSYARGIEESSFMIKLIMEVIYDIRYFLLIMIIFIASLAFSSNIIYFYY